MFAMYALYIAYQFAAAFGADSGFPVLCFSSLNICL